MNTRIRRSLISHARRLSLSWEPRTIAKNKCKVDAALHKCTKCGVLAYEGKSDKNYEAYVQKYNSETVLYEGIKMDHIQPIVDPFEGSSTWDSFFENLFCAEDNYRGLCVLCHDLKTKAENSIRNTYYRPRRTKGKK